MTNGGVAELLPQAAQRHVRLLRQEHTVALWWHGHLAAALRPQTRQRAQQAALANAGASDNKKVRWSLACVVDVEVPHETACIGSLHAKVHDLKLDVRRGDKRDLLTSLQRLNLAQHACQTARRGAKRGHQVRGPVDEGQAVHHAGEVAAHLADSSEVNPALEEHLRQQYQWDNFSNRGVEELVRAERDVQQDQLVPPMEQLMESLIDFSLAFILTTIECNPFRIITDMHHGVAVVCLELLDGVVDVDKLPGEVKRDKRADGAVA
mmetsp:Transcript_891/g.2466  ORF Transcript_891/g.2466 Transcript_891/m.2466 type:complete len:265 (-) Transcript_891:1923-2717(-)